MQDLLHKLPKVDLHLHLDGSVKSQTFLELALENHIKLPTYDIKELSSYLQIEGECESLKVYLKKFDFVLKLLHTAEALERVAFELVEQAAQQNCKYIEVRFAPQLHREKGLSIDDVIGYVLEGLKKGEQKLGVKARGIAICMRHHSDAENIEVIHTASKYMHKGMVAVDLAGDEASFPAKHFIEVFSYAKKLEIPITIHAGEAAGADNIYDAVTKLGASRIGHGIRLKEDSRVFEIIHRRKIPLELCPISNIQTKAALSWKDYPVREYFEDGILVTVNTDNLTVSNTSLAKEYEALTRHFLFSTKEIRKIIMNGVDAAFLSDSEKLQLRDVMDDEFEKVGL